MKDKLGKLIMKKFVGLRAKTCNYLKDNNDKDKKAKGTKMYVIKRKLELGHYKNSLEAPQTERKINYSREKKLMWLALRKIKKNL